MYHGKVAAGFEKYETKKGKKGNSRTLDKPNTLAQDGDSRLSISSPTSSASSKQKLVQVCVSLSLSLSLFLSLSVPVCIFF